MNTDEVTLTIRDQTDTEVWEHEADLTGHYPEISLDMLVKNRAEYSSWLIHVDFEFFLIF